jgi:hypothetical protein
MFHAWLLNCSGRNHIFEIRRLCQKIGQSNPGGAELAGNACLLRRSAISDKELSPAYGGSFWL